MTGPPRACFAADETRENWLREALLRSSREFKGGNKSIRSRSSGRAMRGLMASNLESGVTVEAGTGSVARSRRRAGQTGNAIAYGDHMCALSPQKGRFGEQFRECSCFT